ncbi:MAG: RNA polymerase sigma factor [Pseudomonadales bacterium]|nr:RNA polymerase sigma factor [Pseudomonadales bacterium]
MDSKQRAYSEWLVVRCQQGDPAAFRLLVAFWEKRLLPYALRRMGDREAAQDATQECLLAVSRGLKTLTDPGAFPKWIFQILERRCVDALRRKIRERQIIAETDLVPERGTEDNTENELTVRKLLKDFDPAIRIVLQLHYRDGFSVIEIAEIIGVPAGTVKSRLFYARKALLKKATSNTEED